MIDPNDIDKQMEIFQQFDDPELRADQLGNIQQAVRSEMQTRRRRRFVFNLTGVAAAAAVVVLVVGIWFGDNHNDKQLAALQQSIDQFVAAAESSQLTGATSELDEQIDAVEDMLTQWQTSESQSTYLDLQIEQLEEQLEDLANSV